MADHIATLCRLGHLPADAVQVAASSDAAVLAEYERLRSNNSPIVATAFAERNRAALTRARAARN